MKLLSMVHLLKGLGNVDPTKNHGQHPQAGHKTGPSSDILTITGSAKFILSKQNFYTSVCLLNLKTSLVISVIVNHNWVFLFPFFTEEEWTHDLYASAEEVPYCWTTPPSHYEPSCLELNIYPGWPKTQCSSYICLLSATISDLVKHIKLFSQVKRCIS